MWLYRYVVCLIRKHIFIALGADGEHYQYCLRCGKLTAEPRDGAVAHDELASA